MQEPVLKIEKFSCKASQREKGEIRSLSLNVPSGEVMTLLGLRRNERRMLVDVIAGLNRPDRGTVFFLKSDLHAQDERKLNNLRGKMGILTDPPHFLNNVRIMENMRLPLRYHSRLNTKAIDEKLSKICSALGMKDFPDVIPFHFDQKFLGAAALARALSTSPDLLILERPRESLGEELAFKLPEIWKAHVIDHGGSVLVLTEVPRLAGAISNRVARFESGKMLALESADAFKAFLKKNPPEKETLAD